MDEIHKIVSFLSGQVPLQPVTLKEEETDTELTLIDEYVEEQLLMDKQMSCGIKPYPNHSPCLFQPLNDSGPQLKSFSPQPPSGRPILKNEPYPVNHRYNLRPRKWADQYIPNLNHARPSPTYTHSPKINTPSKMSSQTFNKKKKKILKSKSDKVCTNSRYCSRSEQVSERKDGYKISSKLVDADLKRAEFSPHKKEKLTPETGSDVNTHSPPNNCDFEHLWGFSPDVYIKEEERGDIVIHLRRAKSANLTTWYCCKKEDVAKPKMRSKAPQKPKKRKHHKKTEPFRRKGLQSILRKMLQIDPSQQDSRNPKKSHESFKKYLRTDNRFVEKRSKVGENCFLKRLHRGPYRFACSGCDYKTNTRNQMLIHLRRHTGEKPFKCAHCIYSSVEKSHLTRHMKIHTGERPHKCAFCNYSCIQKVSLHHHLRRCH